MSKKKTIQFVLLLIRSKENESKTIQGQFLLEFPFDLVKIETTC